MHKERRPSGKEAWNCIERVFSMKKLAAIICTIACALGLTACESDLGNKMSIAALNTVIGMGTVFVVLILIIFIISLFRFIPIIQDKLAQRKAGKKGSESIDNTIAQIVEMEENADLSDDLELVAVIAAAIAASEGAASADGFVVRSIRKANRARRA